MLGHSGLLLSTTSCQHAVNLLSQLVNLRSNLLPTLFTALLLMNRGHNGRRVSEGATVGSGLMTVREVLSLFGEEYGGDSLKFSLI